MSKRHRRSKADRQLVTRRYIARVVQRARDDVIHAVLFATATPDTAGNVAVWPGSNSSSLVLCPTCGYHHLPGFGSCSVPTSLHGAD